MIVAEMGKGAASSRPCSASTPEGQALSSPVGAFVHAAGEGGKAWGGVKLLARAAALEVGGWGCVPHLGAELGLLCS